MENPKSLSDIVSFQDIPTEITNNEKISCFFSIATGYTPHRLDKIHLCPLDYTSDLQELNTWDFVNCQLTENQLYPYIGTVEFPCEKYGFLVMDNANATGYVLRYVNMDGICLGDSNTFQIQLEETESATMGISYVFLNEELKLSSNDLALELTLEPEPKLELNSEPVSKPETSQETIYIPELKVELTNEPTVSSDFASQYPEYSQAQEESTNLIQSDPDINLFPLNAKQNEFEREARGREQIQFLIESQQELMKGSQELELRYEIRQLECDDLTELVQSLELKVQFCERIHKAGFDILSSGLSRLEGVLCPDQRIEHAAGELAQSLYAHNEDLEAVQGQIDRLVRTANSIVEANRLSGVEELREENERLKAEYQSLNAVVKDYESQLILTNQEQAKNSEKLTQLSEENVFLKSYETMDTPPKSDRSRKANETHVTYPPQARPKHLTSPTEKTQSIIHPGRGKSASTFTTVNFLKSCSIQPDPVECPICLLAFDEHMNTIDRTKHVNNCISKVEKMKKSK